MNNYSSSNISMKGTTILCVKKDKDVVIAADGQVSLGNFIWALYHKMWIVTFFTLIANILVVYISASKPEIISIAYLINFAILLVFGFFSTEMQEFTAKRQGLKLKDIILAKSEDEAEILYFMRKYKIKATR